MLTLLHYNPEKLKVQILLAAFGEMIRGGHFNIMVVQRAARLLEVKIPLSDEHAMALLHCVDFDKMGDVTLAYLSKICQDLLKIASEQ
jgi:hypothetical protein